METDLIFHRGVDLPEFAAFPLLGGKEGRLLLADYYAGYAVVARDRQAPLLLESPTWRASPDWVGRLGFGMDHTRRFNADAVEFLHDLGTRYLAEGLTGYAVSGMVGPRGDGYAVAAATSADEAAEYHRPQIAAFAASGADLVTAYTLTDPAEAVGIVLAARDLGIPVALSFTVETDGRLPGGQSVAEAIREVDAVAAPEHYLLNCANPAHMLAGLPAADDALAWQAWRRIIGIRVNASLQSHTELDEAETLDEGDLDQLVAATSALASACGPFAILGGCCGTDARHVAALWRSVSDVAHAV